MGLFRRRQDRSLTPDTAGTSTPAATPPQADPGPGSEEDRVRWQQIADTPVTNPALLDALALFRSSPSDDNLLVMLRALRAATLLAAVIVEEAPGSSENLLAKGSAMTFLTLLDNADTVHLALFTDHDALRAHVGEHSGWTGLVLLPEQVWLMAGRYPGGAVLNVAGPITATMTHDKIRRMFELTG